MSVLGAPRVQHQFGWDFYPIPLTVGTIHVKGPALLALVPLAAAVGVGPEPCRLRALEPLIAVTVLVGHSVKS